MSKKGFTLIELLIAIVLMGLIVAIATGAYKGVREKAYDAAAIEEIGSLTVMAEAYFADHFTYPNSEADMNYSPSPGIVVTEFKSETANGRATVHIHLHHTSSPNYFHVKYPEEPIEKRKI